MEKIIIKNNTLNLFSSTKSMHILANFLTDDVGIRVDPIINWLNNDKYESAILNYSYIKKSDDKVLIYFLYDRYKKNNPDNREHFETTKSLLTEILKQWENSYIQKSSHIIIDKTQEGFLFNQIHLHNLDV